MDKDERTERRGNNGELKRDAKVAKEGTANRGMRKRERKLGGREKLLSTSQVVIRLRFVST